MFLKTRDLLQITQQHKHKFALLSKESNRSSYKISISVKFIVKHEVSELNQLSRVKAVNPERRKEVYKQSFSHQTRVLAEIR